MSSEVESLRAEVKVKQQLKKEMASADFISMRVEIMSCMCFGNMSDLCLISKKTKE